jgi:NAD(P)-dependent dehydrogenase (short-subunit alcohol dehydrogenase family)
MKLKPLNEQVVVVMGASSGIGRATAMEFARRGSKVVVAARGREALDSLVEEIRQAGWKAVAAVADVTSFDQVKAVAETAVREFGGLDTWVHAAAVSVYATFEKTTPEEFKHVFDVNLLGQAHGALAALPHLRRRGGGALIHISSVESRRALPYQSAYAASKHGMVGMLDALRMELKHDKVPVSVTNIMPASINTPFFDHARTKIGVKPRGVPPVYQPEIVAEAILYAAAHPVRDLVVGGAGRALIGLQGFSPKAADLLLQSAFELQKTDQYRPESWPGNFHDPIEGDHRIKDDGPTKARSFSVFTWLERHPAVKQAVFASFVLGGLAAMFRRSLLPRRS